VWFRERRRHARSPLNSQAAKALKDVEIGAGRGDGEGCSASAMKRRWAGYDEAAVRANLNFAQDKRRRRLETPDDGLNNGVT
jgi:hypothetical protein